jgi:selenocysteine lyase/cysteine desulfurase
LDHAATSWPKPPGSVEACVDYQRHVGAAAGRGVYRSAEDAATVLKETRSLVAKWINASNDGCIAFCANGTQALNAAIFGLLRAPAFEQCHVVTTATEHNSVLRPLAWLAKHSNITWTAVACDPAGYVQPSRIADAMCKDTKLVIVNHASNVTGTIQDLASIADIAKKGGALFLVDAAQTLGYLPIDVDLMGIDLLAAPGHKGAGGMLGTGILYCHRDIHQHIQPLWLGGTGTVSDSIDGPFDWQSITEAGNLNLPAIASLRAGIQWVLQNDSSGYLQEWTQRLLDSIQALPTLRLVGRPNDRVSVVSVASDNLSCHEMAMLLDSAMHVETRSGLHCAGYIHSYLDTQQIGGTLRLSLGHTSTFADVEAAIEGIQLLGSMSQ